MDWKLKFRKKPLYTSSGFWYDIVDGYINPRDWLEDVEQVKMVNQAVKLVRSFEKALFKNGLLEDY